MDPRLGPGYDTPYVRSTPVHKLELQPPATVHYPKQRRWWQLRRRCWCGLKWPHR